MILRNIVFIIVFLYESCFWHVINTQTPPISCPQYFQYLRQGNTNFGLLTIPNIVLGTNKVYVQLSQRESLAIPNYYGRLALYETQEATANRIYRQQPVYYRIDFPMPNVLPKITLISVNDVAICRDNEYPPPSFILRLMHSLSSKDFGASLMPYQNTQQQQQTNTRRPAEQQGIITSSSNQATNFQTPQRIPQVSTQTQPQTPTSGVRTYAECGLENQVITPFIVGGQELSPHQFPWLAAIYINTGGNLKFTCGGTLVSQRTVLTAAHCVSRIDGIVEVHLGRYDIEDYSERFETRRVQQIIKHPEFRPTQLPDADIAILHLNSPVGFTTSVRPICLWNEQIDVNFLVGQKAAVAGWGEDQTRRIQSKPRKSNSNIVSSTECQGALQRNLVPATVRALCVRSTDGSTPCRGDSGGGLIVYRNGRWILRGIISGGNSNDRGCLLDYTFFCDLAQHRTWIYRNII